MTRLARLRRFVAFVTLVAMGAAGSGCAFTETVQTQVVRGTPKVTERPAEGATPLSVRAVGAGASIDVTVSPARCIATTETPITKKNTTTKTPKWTNSAWWIVGGAALAGLGTVAWVQAADRPEDCPPEQHNCSTRGSARTGAAIAWALGAGAAGYGVYRLVKPNETVTQTETHAVERESAPPQACKVALSGVPVELRLGGRTLATAVTDANGHANLVVAAAGLPARRVPGWTSQPRGDPCSHNFALCYRCLGNTRGLSG